MFKLFAHANQTVSEYVAKLHVPHDLMELNPNLELVPPTTSAVEVHEVNDDAVWELWHDSVAFQDSQFADGWADETPRQSQPTAPEVAAPFIDAFASAQKKAQ